MTRTATAPARPRTSTSRATPARRATPVRPPLALVPAAPWRPKRAPFVILSLVVVAVGLLGLLVLNTVLAQDAFRRHDLERKLALLSEQEQALARDVVALESPERLAQQATELGLVPAGPPAFIRLSDGALIGTPSVATPSPAPVASAVSSASAAPAPKASTAAKPRASAQARPSTASSAAARPKPSASTAPQARPTPAATPKPTPTSAPAPTPTGRP